MPLSEEIIVGYAAYKAKIDELEKGLSKERIVFLFEGGDTADSTWCPETAKMIKLLDDVKKENIHGHLVRVRIPQAEWKAKEPKFQADSKFKVTSLPFGAVFNVKTTLGRSWIHKKIEGDKIQKTEKIVDLFK